jgi:peptidoglycan/xylan/chitin deacetylase (PgdA/CDA1 family)
MRSNTSLVSKWVKSFGSIAVLLLLWGADLQSAPVTPSPSCSKPLYLTFDTGHMGVAPFIAQALNRHEVKVTFFVANELTQVGDGTLGVYWQKWWQERAQEGHSFASHTLNHVYWVSDVSEHSKSKEGVRFWVKPSAGSMKGQKLLWSSKEYCQEIQDANERIKTITSKEPLPLFRAPGGKASPALLAASKACGFLHVAWSQAGFLGDELSSDQFSNQVLLKKALSNIKTGDILMAHLGIWSRADPWATGVLEPLIVGLKEKGFCFKTLDAHPHFAAWISKHSVQ